jgi:hypothetical protein
MRPIPDLSIGIPTPPQRAMEIVPRHSPGGSAAGFIRGADRGTEGRRGERL